MKIKYVDKPWIPNNVCKTCREHLRQWMHRKRRHLKLSVPMVWREPKNHYDDCYFCLINLHGAHRKKKTYPDLESAKRPVLVVEATSSKPLPFTKPLHNGNKHGAVPIAHSTKLKKEYRNKFLVLEKLKYHASKSIMCEYIIIWISFLKILALTVRNKKSDFIRN
jgi:hypothetical protein